jgi:hypothetical protein
LSSRRNSAILPGFLVAMTIEGWWWLVVFIA